MVVKISKVESTDEVRCKGDNSYENTLVRNRNAETARLLEELLTEKGLKKSRVIKNAELSEVYGYQIFSGVRIPERKKLLCLAVGMELNLGEVQQLLKCAGYPQLYAKLPFDSTVLYVVQINELLYEYGLETLG